MKKYKIQHFRKNCIGCNACVLNAPQTWVMNEKDGQADLLHSQKRGEASVAELLESDLADNLKAAKDCPMNIIKIPQSK